MYYNTACSFEWVYYYLHYEVWCPPKGRGPWIIGSTPSCLNPLMCYFSWTSKTKSIILMKNWKTFYYLLQTPVMVPATTTHPDCSLTLTALTTSSSVVVHSGGRFRAHVVRSSSYHVLLTATSMTTRRCAFISSTEKTWIHPTWLGIDHSHHAFDVELCLLSCNWFIDFLGFILIVIQKILQSKWNDV